MIFRYTVYAVLNASNKYWYFNNIVKVFIVLYHIIFFGYQDEVRNYYEERSDDEMECLAIGSRWLDWITWY